MFSGPCWIYFKTSHYLKPLLNYSMKSSEHLLFARPVLDSRAIEWQKNQTEDLPPKSLEIGGEIDLNNYINRCEIAIMTSAKREGYVGL